MDEFPGLFIRANESIPIIRKVQAITDKFLSDVVYPIDAFGFPSKARGMSEEFAGSIKLIHSKGVGYISRDEVKRNADIIDKYKITIGILVPCNGEVGLDPSKGYKAITTPKILKPGEVTTFSYLVLGAFDTEEEAENFRDFMMCKFPRYMLRLTYSSMHIARQNFMFVPCEDYTHHWSDEELYEKYSLTTEEIALIESTIRKL